MSQASTGAGGTRTRARLLITLAVAAAMLLTAAPVTAHPEGEPVAVCEGRDNNSYRLLLPCLTADGVMEHLVAFQAIAELRGDGNRASGTPGYDASVDYVVQRLRRAGYEPTVQSFEFPFFAVSAQLFAIDGVVQDPYDAATGTGTYAVMTYSGSGTVTDAEVVPTLDVVVPIGDSPPNTSTSGCEPEDFTPAPSPDAVALVQRGTCPFFTKALNAQNAGYGAVIVFNEGQPGREAVVAGTLGPAAVGVITVPVLGVSYATGVQLIEDADSVVTIDVTADSEVRTTTNVVAELEGRRSDNVVMLGAHLDSVPEGAGINDNGSGSAAILEVAENMRNNRPRNTVRFAWWGAEEFGLIGSAHYVNTLTPEELDRIALYLNFDMVASPNFQLGVYDGDESTFDVTPDPPAGSAGIEDVFAEFYAIRGEPYVDTEFSGRSDYQAFILSGIPAGGLFTGAEAVKSEELQALFGGVAGIAFDPCYHQACDDLVEPNAVAALEEAYGAENLVGNVNLIALDINVDAIGYAALTFARSTRSLDTAATQDAPAVRAQAQVRNPGDEASS